jgi:hypothetical protein
MEGTDLCKNECSNEVGEFLQELSFAVDLFEPTALTRSGYNTHWLQVKQMATFQPELLSESLAPKQN